MSDKLVQPSGPGKWELFVIPGSHFDLGWCGDPAECLAYSDFIILEAIRAITGDYLDYRFTIEYALFMEHFLKRFPEYEPIVKDLIDQGKVEICTTAVGSMEQILDGELMIRAIIEGQRYVMDTFGVKPITAQHTDLPGHAWQMPQILAHAGVKYMVGSRFHPSSVLFYRTAPDGSRVLFGQHCFHYNWGFILRKGLDTVLEQLPSQISEVAPYSPVAQLLMGEEHDLSLPAPEITETIKDLNSRDLPYITKTATITEFFKAVDGKAELQSYTGEAPYGFYTAPAFEPDIYMKSRQAENYLATAEKLSSMRKLFGLGSYPADELRDGWKALFYPQDHNFAGRHTRNNEEQRLNKAIFAYDTGKSLTHEAKTAISVNINHQREEFPITIFNPCSWVRTDIFEATATFPTLTDKGVTVYDSEGKEIPCQVVKINHARDGRYDFQMSERTEFTFLFIAENIPALGYKAFYAAPCAEPGAYPSSLDASSSKLSNSCFELTFGEHGLRSIVRKSDGMELVDINEHFFAEPTVLEDLRGDLEDALEEQREKERWTHIGRFWRVEQETLTGRQWRASEFPVKLDVIEAGPVRASLRLSGKVFDSTWEQTFFIYDKLDRIDLQTAVDWGGTRNTLLTIPMIFALNGSQITYESPFAAVRLEVDEFPGSYRGIGGREVQKWIDISGEGAGMTIATASGSHFLRDNSITPILLKSTYSTGEPFPEIDNKGRWEFNHRIMPHMGDWRSEKTYRQGWEHATPLIDGHIHPPIRTIPHSLELPHTHGMIEMCCDHVIVTTIKQSDYSNSVIVRLFECEGYPDPKVGVVFAHPPKSVKKVNLLEEPIEDVKQIGDGACFPIKPWEIVTLLLEY